MSQEAIKSLRKQLHISHSQLFTYLNCSLKFWFMYVQKLPKEHSSIALHFGTAIHSSVEILYQSLKETGKKPPLSLMEMNFSSRFYQGLEKETAPILFKKDMPDTNSAVAMGKRMVQQLHEETVFDGSYSIEGIELPLSADLYDHNGRLLDIQLIGVLDLLLR
ncbi:MAG: PD-(D/E)XK nuclease family protein, partial [Chlorobium sp.]|nr:PD-(D/E)XK nuclease family protein [Chlorobium sp.]